MTRAEAHCIPFASILRVGLVLGLGMAVVGGCTSAIDDVFSPVRVLAPPVVTGPRPLVVWLDYHDGTPTPTVDENCGGAPQPAVSCDGACKDALELGLHARFVGLAIDFVRERPATEYLALIITGGSSADCPGTRTCIGLAPVYCGGQRAGGGYVFTDGGMIPSDMDHWAGVAAHELGHMLGLVHVEAPDVMDQWASGQGFGAGTTVDGGDLTCAGGTTQDEPALLAAALGWSR